VTDPAKKTQRIKLPDGSSFEVKTPAEGWIELVAPSASDYVERFKAFVERVGRTPLSDADKADLNWAIDEMARNAIEWGNREDRSKKLRLSCCVFSDKVVVKIEDEGAGFAPETVHDPSRDPLVHVMERLSEGKRPGGYGVFMTRRLMDEVIYSERGNVVLMTKYF
jgi:anti-sigma regulatory factor (Ser/Thr protein kinase)